MTSPNTAMPISVPTPSEAWPPPGSRSGVPPPVDELREHSRQDAEDEREQGVVLMRRADPQTTDEGDDRDGHKRSCQSHQNSSAESAAGAPPVSAFRAAPGRRWEPGLREGGRPGCRLRWERAGGYFFGQVSWVTLPPDLSEVAGSIDRHMPVQLLMNL